MKVTVSLHEQESIVHFFHSTDLPDEKGRIEWSAPFKGGNVRFYEKNGVVSELTFPADVIITPEPVLYERIQEELTAYRASQYSEIEDVEEDIEEGPSPYDPNKIKVRRDFFSIREIFTMIDVDKSIDLNPEFQRYFVWDTSQKSQFIESLLLGLPIPLFYFAENKDLTFSVVDGLQRLTTICQFMRNEFAVKGLTFNEFNGKYFKPDVDKDISASRCISYPMARRIEGTQIVVNIIESSSPIEVKLDIFRRINSGGKQFNNQEMRNCMASSRTRKLLTEMVHTSLFRQATGESISPRRMEDQELALRFIGFWLVRRGVLKYTGNMTNFLNNLIEVINEMKQREQQVVLQAFNTSLNNALFLFGKYAFRKCLLQDLAPGARRQSINKSLFTIWTVSLSEADFRGSAEPGVFARLQAEKLENESAFFQNVTTKTNDLVVIEKVFISVNNLIKEYFQTVTV